MDTTVARFVDDLIARVDGPLHFRIILQPVMASLFAIKDGLRDARNGDPAYFWSLFTDSHLRPTLIRNGWRSIARIFFLAVILDAAYQLLVLHWFYPFETLLVAIVLALLPYALLRGLVNRVKRAFTKREISNASRRHEV